MLVRCTARLLKLFGSRSAPLVDGDAGVDDWYANVLMIERRKCLLLVHAETLFAVLDTDVRVKQFNDLGLYVGRSSLTRGAMIRTCGWSSAGLSPIALPARRRRACRLRDTRIRSR
jgi:hypothetical protein